MMRDRRDGIVYFVTTTIISMVVYLAMSLVVPQIIGNVDPVGFTGYIEVIPDEDRHDIIKLDWKFGIRQAEYEEEEDESR